jgi:glycosyltransferase involved in cell wall biosynthesis
MKIIYHHRTLGDGAEGIHIREMIAAFRSLGHEVLASGPVGESRPEVSIRASRLARIKKKLPQIAFEIAELGYSIASFLRTLYEIARYRPDFIYDRYITFNAGVVAAGRLTGVPVLLEVNAPLALERSQQKDEKLILRRIAFAMERWICRKAHRVIVVSTPLREYLLSVGVEKARCVVMANGANPDRFTVMRPDHELRKRLNIGPQALVLGFTGVLRGWHGLDLLLEALAALSSQGRDVAVLIVGDGPYRGALQAKAADLGVTDRMFITGLMPHDQVPFYVNIFDVAVSPAATFYASPMKVIEYMAMGKAVVVPDTANFLDIVEPGVTGCTFSSGSATAMARELAALQDDPATIVRIGLSARQRVEQRLNWRRNAREACQLAAAGALQ